MEIILSQKNIINDVSGQFLMELQSTDPIPPKGVLIQSINEARARLCNLLKRYMSPTFENKADDSLASADNFVYDLNLSTRKSAGKSQAIADTMHSFLVQAVLTKSYSNMGQQEMAAKHEALSVSDAQVLTQLLNSKIPPVV